MSALRGAIALLVVAAAGFAFYQFCVLPYRCNLVKGERALATDAVFKNPSVIDGKIAARRNIDALLPCAGGPGDAAVDMLLAANYRALGLPQEAIRYYRHALRLDRRPEIYANLAAAEAAVGDRQAAHDDLMRACLFLPWYIRLMDDGLLRQSVLNELIARRPEDADMVRYAESVTLPE